MFALASTIVAVVLVAAPPPAAAVDAATRVTQATSPSQSQTKQELVDINIATAVDLQAVPGIGEALARRIIEFREEHGRFEKVDDLLNVRGIGVTSLEKLRAYLVVKPKG